MARYDFENEGTCSESVSFSLDGGRLASDQLAKAIQRALGAATTQGSAP